MNIEYIDKETCQLEPYCYLEKIHREILFGYLKKSKGEVKYTCFQLKKWISNNRMQLNNDWVMEIESILKNIEYLDNIQINNKKTFVQQQYIIRIEHSITRKLLYILPAKENNES